MSRVHLETEHQELFAVDADLRKPIPVHIPSALGTLGYFVCLRVPGAFAERGGKVVTSLKVGGLRPDDVTLRYGEGVAGPGRYESKRPGHVWLLFCRANVSRGDGHLRFEGLPAGLDRADVLLCTWPRFITSGQADDWIACQSDPQWASGGVPLGGIGCGKVELSRDGRFRNFSGNNNQDMPFEEPDGLDGAYLSVAVQGKELLLATRAASGLEPVRALAAALAFPQVSLRAAEAVPGVDVEMVASGPIVPHDLELSSLPGFVLRWTVNNRTAEPVRVTCRLAWPNLVGRGGGIGTQETRTGYGDGSYRYWDAEDRPQVSSVQGDGYRGLRYANAPSSVCPAADGFHYVVASGTDGVKVQADPRRGSVAKELSVPAGGRATAVMAVVWEMPHWIDSLGEDRGAQWQNHCPGGIKLVELMLRSAEPVFEKAGELARLIGETDLPGWLKSRLVNCCSPLVTNSVFYRDGRFSINEGPTEMSGVYGTLDQRLGAHPATQLLYPELNRRELQQFAAYQSPNGGVNHDFGGGHLESGPRDQSWPDLTCSFILQLARHAWSTGDAAFERENWPRAKRALLRHRIWADQGDGVAQVGKELGTSYDGYHYYGTTPYVATLWIAALQVCRAWATRMGDRDFLPAIDPLIARARERMETDLWNGRYYRAFGSPSGPVNDNCHAGMLAGEYFARFLAGEDVLPDDRIRSCIEAFLALNGSDRFAIPPDEASPDRSHYSEYGWLPYVECFGLAPMALWSGTRVLPLWEKILRAMDGNGKHPCDTRLMYQPVTGAQSWGSYYMTAPASWLVYDALLDFAYWPADGLLRLAPKLEGKFAVVHPLFWAIGQAQDGRMSLSVRRVCSADKLQIRKLELPQGSGEVQFKGQRLSPAGNRRRYDQFTIKPEPLTPGAEIAWVVTP